MKLPGADRAFVDLAKLGDYCLNPLHPRGRHKARVFAERLAITTIRAETLRPPQTAHVQAVHADGQVLRFLRQRTRSTSLSGQRLVSSIEWSPQIGRSRDEVLQ